ATGPGPDPYGDARRSAESAADRGTSAYGDRRADRGSSEEPRRAPSGAEDPAGAAGRSPGYGTDSAAGDPRRYASGAGYRLDPDPGSEPRRETGDGDPFDPAGSRGPGDATPGPDAADAYGDELSRPYSRWIGADSSGGPEPWRPPEPSARPSDALGDPAPGPGTGQDGAGGTASGNTWAFSRDDTRLPEDVRRTVEEQRRKRRDGSPEYTTANLTRQEDEGGSPDGPESGRGGGATAPSPAADLGDDPLAAIAAQQARARAADGAAADPVTDGGPAGPGSPEPEGSGPVRAPAGDELGPDLRGPSSPPAGDELGPDRRGGGPAPAAGDGAFPGGRSGDPAPYGASAAAEPYGRRGEYEESGEHRSSAASAASPGSAPDGPWEAERGAAFDGYGSSGPQGREPEGPGADGGHESSGSFARSHPGYSEYADRRGPESGRDGLAGPGAPDEESAHRRPAAGGPDGPDTAAMDLPGPGAYGDDAGAYGPGGAEGAPDGGGAGYDGQDREARSSRDPIREEFPDFDRPLGGTAGDDYPGYDNIDHWPDTAPEASATLWLGISALVPLIGLLTGVAALVTGPRATRAIRRSEDGLEGLNLVRLGTVLAWVGIGLSLLETAVYAGGVVLS
ncbi:hypothetical protein ACFFN5_24905, partial [Streptomonospora salina]